jgi:hypothetical protein
LQTDVHLHQETTTAKKIIQSQKDVLNYYNFQAGRFHAMRNRARVNERLHSNIDMILAITIGIISAIIIPGVQVYMKTSKVLGDIPISIFFSWMITIITVITSKCEFAVRCKDYAHVVESCDKVLAKINEYRDHALYSVFQKRVFKILKT